MKEDEDVEFSSPKPLSAFQAIPESNVVKSVTTPGGSVLIPHTITTVTLCSNSPHPFSSASVSGSSGVANGNGSSSSLLVHRGPASSSSQVPINTTGASVIGAASGVQQSASQQQLQSHSFYITQQQSANSKGSSEVSFAQAQQQSPKGLAIVGGGNGTAQHSVKLMQAQSVTSPNVPSPSDNNNSRTTSSSQAPSSFAGKKISSNSNSAITSNSNPTVSHHHLGAHHPNACSNANNHLNASNNNVNSLSNHNGSSGAGTLGTSSSFKNTNNHNNSNTSYNGNNNGNNATGDLVPTQQQHPVFVNANNHVNVISSASSGNITLATTSSSGGLHQVPVASLAVPNNCQISGNNNTSGSGGGQTGTMLQQQPPMNLSFPRIPPSPDSALGGWSTPSSNLSRHNSDASQRSFSSSSNNTTPPSPSNSPLLSHNRVVNKVEDYGT